MKKQMVLLLLMILSPNVWAYGECFNLGTDNICLTEEGKLYSVRLEEEQNRRYDTFNETGGYLQSIEYEKSYEPIALKEGEGLLESIDYAHGTTFLFHSNGKLKKVLKAKGTVFLSTDGKIKKIVDEKGNLAKFTAQDQKGADRFNAQIQQEVKVLRARFED